MDKQAFYQLIGEAYCAGRAEAMEKRAGDNITLLPLGTGVGALGGLLQSATNGWKDPIKNILNKTEKGTQMGLTGVAGGQLGEMIGDLLAPSLNKKLGLAEDSTLLHRILASTGALGGLTSGYFLPTFTKNPFAKEKKD